MKSEKEIATMLSLFQAGWSKRKIATELGISRNTLKRYLKALPPPSGPIEIPKSKQQICRDWLADRGEESPTDTQHREANLKANTGINVSRRTIERAAKHLKGSANPPAQSPPCQQQGWRIGPYVLSSSGELSLAKARIALTTSQQQLLLLLAEKANQVVDHAEIAQRLWPDKTTNLQETRAQNLAIHRLRQIFQYGPLGGAVISSVYGKGYVLNAPVNPIHAPQAETDERQRRKQQQATQMRKASTNQGFSPASLDNPFYWEAHDYWSNRDPYKLPRQETLLRKSVEHNPGFEQGWLELCYFQMLQCFWGMRSSRDVLPTLEKHMRTMDHLPLQPSGWLGIKAEMQSLFLWQPHTTQSLYGSWLAETLPRGMPQLAWARHLIFTGKPKTAMTLLKRQVHDELCHGWLVLAMAYCAMGDLAAAEEAIHRQLSLDSTMVGTRLFLALVQSMRGSTASATALVQETGILDRPFQGVQALVAYTLAQGRLRRNAHQLLDQALQVIQSEPSSAGGIGYWGLAASALDRQQEAIQLLKMSITTRCYSAPVLLTTPFLQPYANTLAAQMFVEGMRKSFPIGR
jgi:DNA-binding winged helix-turn-helix (wHTH) protein